MQDESKHSSIVASSSPCQFGKVKGLPEGYSLRLHQPGADFEGYALMSLVESFGGSEVGHALFPINQGPFNIAMLFAAAVVHDARSSAIADGWVDHWLDERKNQ
jgi:hypothetical protein